jgi:FkbM family methyltransferase
MRHGWANLALRSDVGQMASIIATAARHLGTAAVLASRENKLASFDINLGLPADSPLAACQGKFDLYCIDEQDARIIVGEVFSDALNGYFGKGGLTVPKAGATIVDVGANIGSFAVFMHKVVPDCKVHAFEPIPETYSTMAANFERFNIQGKVHNIGLGKMGCPPVLKFTHFPNRPACSTYRPEDKERANIEPLLNNPATFCGLYRETQPELVAKVEASEQSVAMALIKEFVEDQWRREEIECPMRCLEDALKDDGIQGQIDFLKVDVEGAELDVLLGISDETWSRVEQVAIEVHDFDNRLEDVQALLLAQGFQHVVAHGIDLYNDEYGMNHHFVYGRRL